MHAYVCDDADMIFKYFAQLKSQLRSRLIENFQEK